MVEGTSSESGGSGGGGGARHYFAYAYVPTCSQNSPDSVQTVCDAAVASCATNPGGGIQIWVYRIETDAAGTRLPGASWQLVNTRCTQTFAVTTPEQIRALLLSDRRFIPAPPSRTRIDPRSGRTLVNAEVVFSADTPRHYSVDVPVLGQQVHLDLAPQRWEWHFGDEVVRATSTPGSPYPAKDITHRYRSKGAFAPYVAVTWSGTFSFNGASYPIDGSVTIDGPPTPLQVAEARSHLVSGEGD